MEKTKVLKKIIEETEKKKEEEEKRVEKIQEDIVCAPDYRQTWSDTTKFQLRQVKNNLDKSLSKTKRALKILRNIKIEKTPKKADIGAILKVRSEQKTFYYLLVPAGAATNTIRIEEKEVTATSPGSPLAQKAWNKKEKEEFSWQDKKFKILKIF